MEHRRKLGKLKRLNKGMELNFWDCSLCTFRNTAEAFKCLMCDVRKGTSTRKPRLNSSTLAAQQAAVKNFPSGSGSPSYNSKQSGNSSKHKALRRNTPRIKNIDRTTAQTREVTINSVTVLITEYLPKKIENRTEFSESQSESNDSIG
uniref:CSON011455 protein n=1 Tax=Culicoides sonorensis TaxID=179676 RepID=A0A336LHX2_CULSO